MKANSYYSMFLEAARARSELTNDLDSFTSGSSLDTEDASADVQSLKQQKEDKNAEWETMLARLCSSGQWPELSLTGSGEEHEHCVVMTLIWVQRPKIRNPKL